MLLPSPKSCKVSICFRFTGFVEFLHFSLQTRRRSRHKRKRQEAAAAHESEDKGSVFTKEYSKGFYKSKAFPISPNEIITMVLDPDYDSDYYDDDIFEDDYSFMQDQFDNADLPPGVEASLPWF
ncbi:(E3-independent) E2 ubiquitin-conjugating enzyme [Trifolium repens]|nr:(E3-independent) E2 ubiquitin-conjugating enzyme [Trifolium repens]